ncbi:uncharacterized protein LOC134281825 [Saccostrea cucullata]|uniref:uncharacterized protein LOC134281825 n=1 Tax=Saccostrea cuccullata TaxID=36930 RepID=UPI002ED5019C
MMGDAPSPSVLYFNPKKSTENFARLCQFLVTICCDVMRDILCQHIKPANLRMELDKNKSKLEKITNKQEKDLLYPPHSSSSSVPQIRFRDLDLSLLYKILRNLCNIPTHIAGWGNPPRQSDFSLAACIERIRILRNSISGHSTNGTVDDMEYEDYWRNLRTSVVEIEREVTGSDRYERGIDHLYDCDLNPTKSKEYVDEIRRCSGEMKIKRERIYLVEEEVETKRVRLDTIYERQAVYEDSNVKFKANVEARLTEIAESLTAIKSETCLLKGLKTTESILQHDKGLSSNSNSMSILDEIITSDTTTYTISKSTTTIKFNSALPGMAPVSLFSMHSTINNKCWLLVPHTSPKSPLLPDTLQCSRLYLLSDIGVIKEIKIPEEYDIGLISTQVKANEESEAVFAYKHSLVAIGENGVFRKMFDFDVTYKHKSICRMHSGNYIITKVQTYPIFNEYNNEGSLLSSWELPEDIRLQHSYLRVYQNSNRDMILTNHHPFGITKHLCIEEEFRNVKWTLESEEQGIIIPVLNKKGEFLYGHGRSIDLMNSEGEIVDTIYKTPKDVKIRNLAYSSNGTIWVLYNSSEIDIFKVEIPKILSDDKGFGCVHK